MDLHVGIVEDATLLGQIASDAAIAGQDLTMPRRFASLLS